MHVYSFFHFHCVQIFFLCMLNVPFMYIAFVFFFVPYKEVYNKELKKRVLQFGKGDSNTSCEKERQKLGAH